MIRIGIDANPIFLTRSGIGNYTYHLVKHLMRIDHENQYYLYNTETQDHQVRDLNLAGNVKVITCTKWQYRRKTGEDKIDVYHGTSYRLWGEGRLGNVVTIHDLSLVKFPEFSRRLLGERWSIYKNRMILRKVKKIIAVSRNTAKDISTYYQVPAGKIAVVYNGVGEEFYPSLQAESIKSARERLQIPAGDYLFYTGGSEPRKNLGRLLEAFARLLRTYQGITLVVTGGMGRRAEAIDQKISRLHLDERVVVIGHVPNVDMRALYSGAKLFVYPSLYEGFGIPILEAMACQVPVVASNTSAVPEVAGDAAFLIDPYDVQGMAQAMEKVLTDEGLYQSLRAKGIERAKEFSWEKAAQQTLQIYHEVASC